MKSSADILARLESQAVRAGAPIGNQNARKGRIAPDELHASLPRLLAIESLSRRLPAIIYAKKPDKHAAVKKLHDRVRNSAQKVYQSALDGVLAVAEAEILRKIHSLHGQGSVQASSMTRSPALAIKTPYNRSSDVLKATNPLDLMFDLKSFGASFADAMSDAAKTAFTVCAQGLIENPEDEADVTDQGIINDFAFDRANKLKNCPQNIFDQVQRSLEEGDRAGETMDELTARVQDEFKGISEGRAYVIAQTESQCAYGTAQMGVLKAAGYDTKQWMTSEDELVRESHRECEEQGAIDIDEDFDNGLAYPGDPDGDAEDVINCRCLLLKGTTDEDADQDEWDRNNVESRSRLVSRVEKILAGAPIGNQNARKGHVEPNSKFTSPHFPIAAYRDEEGYTVQIAQLNKARQSMGRKGLMFITSPEGETTKAGYWMDFPEKSYGVSDKEWKAMPVAERAKIEVEQQANAYASLKQQFREYKDPAYDASKDPEIKPRNFRDSARASNREEVYA